jgi:hypothetical protein
MLIEDTVTMPAVPAPTQAAAETRPDRTVYVNAFATWLAAFDPKESEDAKRPARRSVSQKFAR